VFLDAEGNVLATQGERTVAGFEKTLKAIGDYAILEKKAAAGDKTVACDLLLTGVAMGKINFAAAKEQAAKLGKLDAEQQKKVDETLLNLEVADVMSGVRTQEQATEAGKKFAQMMNEGRIPTGSAARNFYAVILTAMEAEKDVAGFEKVLGAYKKLIENEPRGARVIEQLEVRLKRLKGDG
jgi:hypothetical protein